MDPAGKEPSLQNSTSTASMYQCTECQRSYSRVDHLARHVRSHLQERPFECDACGKAFGRPDLLKRHAQCHKQGGGAKRQRLNGSLSLRVSEACAGCAISKVRCDDEKPCPRCQHLGIPCEYSGARRFSKTKKTVTKPNTTVLDNKTVAEEDNGYRDAVAPLPTPATMAQADCLSQSNAQSVHEMMGSSNSMAGFLDNQLSDFLRDVMAPSDGTTFSTYNQETSRNVLDFSMDGALDLDVATNMAFLDQLYPRSAPDFWFDTSSDTGHRPGIQVQPQRQFKELEKEQEVQPQSGTIAQAGLGIEAYRKSSLTRCSPAQQKCVQTWPCRLSAVGEDMKQSLDTQVALGQRIVVEPLEARARDRLLSMILSVCNDEKAAAVADTFPPSLLLDELIQTYFRHSQQSSSPFIHAATFHPNVQPTEVLAAVIAAGAVLSDVKNVQEFGYAMQEVIRIIIPKRCEASNAVTRTIWMVQAFAIELELAMWSGNRRTMEISESRTQSLFTMLRRNGKFQKCKKPVPTPLIQDTGETLQQKWLEWVKLESFKRVVFHAFMLDAQASMSLLMNPSLSYAEMLLPIPDSRELWMAQDAEQWKRLYLQQESLRMEVPPSLVSLLHRPFELPSLACCYDVPFTTLVVLHGFWGIIWNYTQLTSVVDSRRGHAAIELHHEDMCQSLNRLRIAISEAEHVQSPEIWLMLELLTMYLHVSLEKIQLFAGKEDLEEARGVLPSLQDWTESSARQAICNAGQVLRAAKNFTPKRLRDFPAVAVYHASLTCWAYGLLSSQKKPSLEPGTSPAVTVSLDGPEVSDFTRFVALGRGTPSIGPTMNTDMSVPALAPLSDPVAVMDVVLGILYNNAAPHSGGNAMPPLVDNFIQLMLDLKEAGRSVVDSSD